jgi:hypothetical protein
MRTEMHDAQPHSIRLVSARKVAFTFDLTLPENANLREQGVVTRSMAAFLLAYDRFESYRAEYVGDWLVLTCTGTITLGVDMDL